MVYTKEFLILELQRFVSENGKNPKMRDMQIKNGYPSGGAYSNQFGTWNNALLKAKLIINRHQHTGTLDGYEVCDNCKKVKSENQHWYYKNEQRLCAICSQNLNNHKNGNLNPNSSTGFAFISQRVVAKTLGLDLEHDCNCSMNFGAPYDLYDKKLGGINVKAVVLFKDNAWHFTLHNKEIPDTYILLGFSNDKSNIGHVWIMDALDDLTFEKNGISVTNSLRGLKRAEPWEVDVKLYNDTYHSMSLENCSVLRSD